MKVFALMCATAIAVSTPMVDAADITCAKSCVSTSALTLTKATTQKFIAPTCTVTAEKAYVTSISFTGATGDKLVVDTVAADGTSPITETQCTLALADTDMTFETTPPVTCGKEGGKGAQVKLTCNEATGASCSVSYEIKYACLTPDDVAVECKAASCTATDLAIPNTKKATFTPFPCANTSEFAYLSAIALDGADSDKLTYVVNYHNGTAITGCAGTTPGKSVTVGTPDALTCGKGDGKDVSVDVACGSTSTGDCKVGGSVTFACAPVTATATSPSPTSMGSMLTKANAIVGLISGMVGAVVYFNRG